MLKGLAALVGELIDRLRSRGSGVEAVTLSASTQVVRMVVRIVLVALVLRYLGPTTKGLIDLAMGVAAIVGFLQLPTNQFMLSALPLHLGNNDGWAVRESLWGAYLLRIASSVAMALVLVAGAGAISSFYDLPRLRPLLLGSAVVALAGALTGPVTRDAFFAMRRPRSAAAIDGLQLAAEAAVTVFVVTTRQSPLTYLILIGLAPVAGYALGWVEWLKLRPTLRGAAAGRSRSEFAFGWIRFSGAIWLAGVANGIYERMPLLVLAWFVTPRQVAFFTTALGIVTMARAVASVPEGPLLSSAAAAHREGTWLSAQLLERATTGILLYSSVIAGAFVLFAPEIIRLVGGDQFLPAAPVLRIVAFLPVVMAVETSRLGFYVLGRPVLLTQLMCVLVLIEAAAFLGLGLLGGASVLLFGATHVLARSVFAGGVLLRSFAILGESASSGRAGRLARATGMTLALVAGQLAAAAAVDGSLDGWLRVVVLALLWLAGVALSVVTTGIVRAFAAGSPPPSVPADEVVDHLDQPVDGRPRIDGV